MTLDRHLSPLPLRRLLHWLPRLAAIVLLVACTTGAQAEARKRMDTPEVLRLKAYLATYIAQFDNQKDHSTHFRAAKVDLRGDGSREVLVFLDGNTWCAHGGCALVILEPHGRNYKVLGWVYNVRTPIRVLPTYAHGWLDLGVWNEAGTEPGYESAVPWDGQGYAEDPRVEPARKLPAGAPGEIVISRQDESIPLYE